MKFVVPMTVDDSNLTTNVANDYSDWSAGTYNLGDRAVEGEYVYEVVASPNTTDQPSVGAAKATPSWILLGYYIQLRMWREGVDSVSDAVGDIEVSVPVPTAISTVGVLNAVGLEVNVQLIDAAIMNIEAPTIEDIYDTRSGDDFTLSVDGTVLLYLNKLKLREGEGYTKSGTTITTSIPQAGDSLIAVIYTADEPTVEDVAGTKDGANTSFTISEAGGLAFIYWGTQKLTDGDGYVRTGTAIEMAVAPGSGDALEAVIFTDNLPTTGDVAGDKDGSNTAFLIPTEGVVSLFLNGARWIEGVDYDQDGIAITANSIPDASDTLEFILYPDILFPGGVIYDSTKSITDIGVGDWWEFFFTEYERAGTVVFDDLPAYFGSGVTIYVTVFSTGPADPSSVGRVVIGPAIDAGRSLQGVESRNLTFSTKDRDEFGGLTLVTKRTIRVISFPVMIPAGNTYYVQQKAAALAVTPTLFIADPNKPETVVFGVFENFDVIVSGFSINECSIGVEEF